MPMNLDSRPAAAAMQHEVEQWRRTGIPSPLPEFVLRNGRAFGGVRHLPDRGTGQQCYMNAALYADDHGLRYVEGYAFRGRPPIPHAWCADGDLAVETTWPVSAVQPLYFGVEFDARRALNRMCETGYYGLFIPGERLDLAFLCQLDPGFRAHLAAVLPRESP
jgi:hypothetical protein